MVFARFFFYNIPKKRRLKMFEMWNPSPIGARVGDCAVRAVSKALGTDWETAYTLLCLKGFELYDMPNSNSVIDALLSEYGFERSVVPNSCPHCYTVADFAEDHPSGTYILGTGNHVVCVMDGTINDSWDSSNEVPIYYWSKKERGKEDGLSLHTDDLRSKLLSAGLRNTTHADPRSQRNRG